MTGDEIVPGMNEPLDVHPDSEPPQAALATPGPRRGGKRTAVVTLVALGVAAGGGAIALAAGGGHSGSTAGPRGPAGGPAGGFGAFGGSGNAVPGAGDGVGGGSGTGPGDGTGGTGSGGTGSGGAPTGRGRAGLSAGGIVHGTFVLPEGSSSTSTETDDVQHGTVSAVSSDALTVASADGFTKSYALDSSTKVDGGQDSVSDVKTGDTVSLVATDSGETATVTTLMDQSQAKKPTGTTSPTTAPTTGNGTDTGGPPAGAGAGGRGPGGFRGAFGGGDDLLLRALHGTYVVAITSGTTTTYATDVVQTGEVTGLSATSISLKSTDGYTATYVIGSATKKDSSVATGKDATVVASGTPATAATVRTAGTRGSGMGGGRPGGWGGGPESGSGDQPPTGGFGGPGGPGGPGGQNGGPGGAPGEGGAST